ncbi:MAG: hypothetical protein JXK95_16080 [Bacteroidales bacterium]|nr:hypothetical protein [Bacteroidales bacterium]
MKKEKHPSFAISTLTVIVCLMLCLFVCSCGNNAHIDRKALVQRHNIIVNSMDSLSSLSVGNGSFAFTVDATGLQTFPEYYERGIPLGTQSEWGWHSFPDTAGYALAETFRAYPYQGRQVDYGVQWNEPGREKDAANYLRQNPHRLHLGVIGLKLLKEEGSIAEPEDIESIKQSLDCWNGVISSDFALQGHPVSIKTCCHQDMDIVASSVRSVLLKQGKLRIILRFPYPTGKHTDSGCDWSQHEKHRTAISDTGAHHAVIHRVIDTTAYDVVVAWSGRAMLNMTGPHEFELSPAEDAAHFTFSCHFTPEYPGFVLPEFKQIIQNSRQGWNAFWNSGAAVDFSACRDERAAELERRVVLSQYLMRIQCAGHFPPQETGLTYNSWFGKFHLEMHWWHAVHHALWGRVELLEKSLGWYVSALPKAEELAQRQGFDGARWQKMTDPSGSESPSSVGAFLIWQQPHFIYFAELCYRHYRDDATLKKYSPLVFKTADFMASYATWDEEKNRYILGPVLIPAQECFDPLTTINPPLELAYWHWGLTMAQMWRTRLGLPPDSLWQHIMDNISTPAGSDGLYLAAESAPDSYTNQRYTTDHPAVLAMFGMLPGLPSLDTGMMKNTCHYVIENWQWNKTWGWDFPLTAMCATRLGFPEEALEALLMDVRTNTYLPNGHNYQDERLRLYLPGNGGLLTTVAMMCAGFDGSDTPNPGFPKDNQWNVRWERLEKMP